MSIHPPRPVKVTGTVPLTTGSGRHVTRITDPNNYKLVTVPPSGLYIFIYYINFIDFMPIILVGIQCEY